MAFLMIHYLVPECSYRVQLFFTNYRNESLVGSYPPNASLASFPQDFVITLLTVLVLIE